MLVQPTPVASLSEAEKFALKSSASKLLMTDEANTGFVSFNGKTIAVSEVRNLIGSRVQQLNEIVPRTGSILR